MATDEGTMSTSMAAQREPKDAPPDRRPRLAEWSVLPDASDSAASLAQRIQRGDSPAEALLVARFSRGVRTVIRHVSSDPTMADDLFQETFRLGLERIRAGALRDPSQVAAFLAGLARTLATEHFRRLRRAPQEDASVLERMAAPGGSSLDAVTRREEAGQIAATLESLPTDRDREVLRRFYLTMDDKERICADLGLTRLQFNRVLHRARERFRELWLASSTHETP
jgi:RNA polymerase sigma-70 factor, ECF subfamily